MSADSQPISPARFAAALQDLPASSLALKVLELRNSIAHLDYANAELKPFAEGLLSTSSDNSTTTSGQQQPPQPDQDCIDAIKENEGVIARMQERIELVRKEVEGRGLSWREFQGKEDDIDDDDDAATTGGGESLTNTTADVAATTNGVNGHGPRGEGDSNQHGAWRDGTFQTVTIRGMSDEELLRQLQSRMPPDDGDDEDPDVGGMHL
ncbi:hypothetical protein F5Y16DRAFT_375357 [Xylariaceae sp. FL0255]|nr:hypothetical protein F5Y16DRAFT_375357 [Xylariaceae sp. FL0255]